MAFVSGADGPLSIRSEDLASALLAIDTSAQDPKPFSTRPSAIRRHAKCSESLDGERVAEE
jgi:hypothetical protein